jgi:branched-chain amino acid transport system ATP-binding protein
MTELLSTHSLSVRYGALPAVSAIDIEVGSGTVVALLGANGAGKSTILKAIAGLVPAQGRILFDGQQINALSTRQRVRRGIVYVPEGREIVTALSVGENLVLGGFHLDRRTLRQRSEMVLGLFPEIAGRARSPAWMLSGGEQQMLAIGRALMAGPRLLLLDEPSLGLAPLLVKRVFERLDTIRKMSALSVVLVEQNFRMTMQLADDVYFLRSGAIVGHRSATDLRGPEAREEAIETYLGGHSQTPAAASA